MLLWPVGFIFKLGWRVRLISMAFLAGLATGLLLQLLEQLRSWGVVSGDQDRQLPGDELVPLADVSETRSLAIAASPAQVWPWLAQMGWGRGGWYSYDVIDMDGSSADTILEEFSDLAEGDLVPTDPGGGFEARVVEPDRALVLYLDSELVNGQLETAAPEEPTDETFERPVDDAGERLSVGLQAAGALGGLSMPEFRATWAFVLEPEPDGTTRLVERMRMWSPEEGLPQRLGLPLMGLGVFAMTRKHMLGVKERAERLAAQ